MLVECSPRRNYLNRFVPCFGDVSNSVDMIKQGLDPYDFATQRFQDDKTRMRFFDYAFRMTAEPSIHLRLRCTALRMTE